MRFVPTDRNKEWKVWPLGTQTTVEIRHRYMVLQSLKVSKSNMNKQRTKC